MEDSKTKYIESSLAAFRAIKTFVFIKGIYPRNFNSGFWDEEDYKNPDLRLSMRNEFEQYLEMLASVHNDYAKTLYDAMPIIVGIGNNTVDIKDMVDGIGRVADDMLSNIVECYTELNLIRYNTDDLVKIGKDNQQTLKKMASDLKRI